MSLVEKLFGSFSDRELKKINPIAKQAKKLFIVAIMQCFYIILQYRKINRIMQIILKRSEERRVRERV